MGKRPAETTENTCRNKQPIDFNNVPKNVCGEFGFWSFSFAMPMADDKWQMVRMAVGGWCTISNNS